MVAERQAFAEALSSMDVTRLVFLDEAGINTGLSANYGWAPPGEAPLILRPQRGQHITLIGAISMTGTHAMRLVQGSVDGDVFKKYLEDDLGPTLPSEAIVVMDGPRLHRVRGVAEILEKFGAVPLYLPAYSPEFNPIEMTWAWLKGKLRKSSIRRMSLLKRRLPHLWDAITRALTEAWVRHCGYDVQST